VENLSILPILVLDVETKRADLSLVPAIPQALAYMLANSKPEKPAFGLITNGNEFRFIKLVRQPIPQRLFEKSPSMSC
jgi:hypothetical protein